MSASGPSGPLVFISSDWTYSIQDAHWSGKSQGKLVFLQGQENVRKLYKMVREIRKSSEVEEKSGNLKILFSSNLSKRIIDGLGLYTPICLIPRTLRLSF